MLKLTIAVQAYSGALVQFQQGGFGSRHGEPAPEGSRLIAASGYREKIAAVIPAREYVDGQQVKINSDGRDGKQIDIECAGYLEGYQQHGVHESEVRE